MESQRTNENLRAEISALFKKASPWDAIKDAGQAAIPAGEATSHYRELQKLCSASGLWIVPVGELEGFCKSVGGHSPGWVQQVIEQHDVAEDEELELARDFVRRLWRSRPSVSVTTTDARAVEGNGADPGAGEAGARMPARTVDLQV